MIFKTHHIAACFLFAYLLANADATGQPIGSIKTDTLSVVIDGHRMFLYSSGKGNCTVIMEAGLGANHTCWKAIDMAIAKKTRVITYDRPGYLQSDSCTKTRDAVTVSRELRQALTKGNISPPYILVGWSLGGSFVRVFAALYPEDVKGLVLIDPAPEESYERFLRECPETLSEDSAYFAEVFSSKRTGEKGELLAFDTSMNQARMSDGKYSSPTKLLISLYGKAPRDYLNDPTHPINRIWTEELITWAGKNKNVEYEIVGNSGHHIARDQPAVIVDAIFKLLEKIKSP